MILADYVGIITIILIIAKNNCCYISFGKKLKVALGVGIQDVDDFYIVHKDKNFLTALVSKINNHLQNDLDLTLHPKKIYIQHYTKGVLFLGVFIKPHRTYIRKRTIGFFYEKIQELNNRLKDNNNKINKELQLDFLSTINSYLGMIKNHKSYKIRKKILLNNVSAYFWNYFYISNNYTLIKRKNGNLGKPTSL